MRATVLVYLQRTNEAERSAREALQLDGKTRDAYLVLVAVHGPSNDSIDEARDLDAFL